LIRPLSAMGLNSLHLLTFGGFLMLGGRTADLYGRRKFWFQIASFVYFSLPSVYLDRLQALIGFTGTSGFGFSFYGADGFVDLLTTLRKVRKEIKLYRFRFSRLRRRAAARYFRRLLTQYLGWQWCFFCGENVPGKVAAIFRDFKATSRLMTARSK